MTNRNFKIIAATTLAIFAGAAAANESQIDYTNMQSSTTRAEVMADTMAFDNMHSTFATQEAYGSVNTLATMDSVKTRGEVMAEAQMFRVNTASSSYLPANEAYNGFPVLDRMQQNTMGSGE